MTDPAAAPETPPDRRRRVDGRLEERLELLVAILLGMAALATAWAAYQASQWDGEEIRAYTDANLDLSDANFFYNQGTQTAVQDELLFLEYVTAIQNDDPDLAMYIRDTLMRGELVAALTWWEEQPEDGPATPFVEENPEYTIDSYDEADSLTEQVDASYASGQEANTAGDAYNLVAVLLAASLFVLGIAGSFKVFVMRLLTIAIGGGPVPDRHSLDGHPPGGRLIATDRRRRGAMGPSAILRPPNRGWYPLAAVTGDPSRGGPAEAAIDLAAGGTPST